VSKPLRLGLVGSGIAHSLSPRLHQKAMELSGLSGTYTLFDCAAPDAARAVFARLRAGELDGLNVTTPFKTLALQAADAWADAAHFATPQSVNTLFMQGNRLVAASTDGEGLAAALHAAHVQVQGQQVLLIGAGGAGQAVADTLLAQRPAQLHVVNRSAAATALLVDRLNASGMGNAVAHAWGEARGLAEVAVIVHATRLGHGQAELDGALDWLPWAAWAAQAPVLADVVYSTDLTPLERLAQVHGLPVDERLGQVAIAQPHPRGVLVQPHGILRYFGQTMLAHQAAAAFELWTGRPVDAGQMLAAIVPTSCT
jgi:shikimate dehydrogenase